MIDRSSIDRSIDPVDVPIDVDSGSSIRRVNQKKIYRKFFFDPGAGPQRASLVPDPAVRRGWVGISNWRRVAPIPIPTHPLRAKFFHSFVRGLATPGPQHQKRVPSVLPGESPNCYVQKPCKKSRFRALFCVPKHQKRALKDPKTRSGLSLYMEPIGHTLNPAQGGVRALEGT